MSSIPDNDQTPEEIHWFLEDKWIILRVVYNRSTNSIESITTEDGYNSE